MLAWRDFYTNILATRPRVSMGRPFHEKYAAVIWENPESIANDSAVASSLSAEGPLQKWKDGMTGYPIVDAGMRCVREMGRMHNRLRMICAMFLCKHLMIDWREGERVCSMRFSILAKHTNGMIACTVSTSCRSLLMGISLRTMEAGNGARVRARTRLHISESLTRISKV